MEILERDKCRFCGSTNIGIGYQLGNGQLFADPYAYHSTTGCSEIEAYLCKDCGCILYQRVKRPELFENVGNVRNEELLAYFEKNGFLLMNEHKTLPSLEELGYNMQNLVYLIEDRKVFYTKALGKKAIYLSTRAYQLLKRVKPVKPLTEDAKTILDEMKRFECVDKADVRKKLGMDAKTFDKAFDFLLDNLFITAYAGKKLNPNWYSYLYSTTEQFSKTVEGLHFNGDPKKALWDMVKNTMDEKSFELLCK